MRLSSLRIDAAAIETGVWLPAEGDKDLPKLPGVRLKVRGLSSLAVSQGRAAFAASLNLPEGAVLTDDQREAMWRSTLSNDVLIDWSGIEDDDDKPIPFDRATAVRLINDPDYRHFLLGVSLAATLADETRPAETASALDFSGQDGGTRAASADQVIAKN